MQASNICPTCSTRYGSNYCPGCGEKRFEEDDLSIGHFYRHVIESVFNIDGLVWRSVYKLIFKPGELTVKYIRGSRTDVMRPMQLFFVVNLFFYVILYNTSFFFSRVDDMAEGYGNYFTLKNLFHYDIAEAVKNKAEAYAINVNTFNEAVEKGANELSKAGLFVLVPLLGLVYYQLFKKRDAYFIEGHVFALHSLTFYMLASMTYILIFYFLGYEYISDVELVGLHALFIFYVMKSIKKVRKLSLIASFLYALVLITAFFLLIGIYKQVILIMSILLYSKEAVLSILQAILLGAACLYLLIQFIGYLRRKRR